MHPDDESGFEYANEFQAAYAVSLREREPDDRGKVKALVKQGRFVVILSYEQFCRFTDASLGEAIVYVGDYSTYEEAEAAVPNDGDYDHSYRIQSPPGYWERLESFRKASWLQLHPVSEDDIPF